MTKGKVEAASRVHVGRGSDDAPLTGRDVTVAVVDSGWSRRISDSRVLRGICMRENRARRVVAVDDESDDQIGHGTACATLILGVAPNARIVPIRVFDQIMETSPDRVIAAIDWAITRRIPLVNLSLGTRREDAKVALYAACERARQSRTLIVAATVDDGGDYPACFASVISVGVASFTRPDDFTFSHNELIECRASGTLTEQRVGPSRNASGAPSYAAPRVTGVLACFLEQFRTLDVGEARQLLARGAVATT